jgi:hypothetical protein
MTSDAGVLFLRLHSCQPAQRHSLRWRHKQFASAKFRASRRSRSGFHATIRRQTIGVLRTAWRYRGSNTARKAHQVMAARVEIETDRRQKPDLARSLVRPELMPTTSYKAWVPDRGARRRVRDDNFRIVHRDALHRVRDDCFAERSCRGRMSTLTCHLGRAQRKPGPSVLSFDADVWRWVPDRGARRRVRDDKD